MTQSQVKVAVYSAAELAQLLGRSRVTIYRWVAAGIGPPPLPRGPKQALLFPREAVHAWLGERPPAEPAAPPPARRSGGFF